MSIEVKSEVNHQPAAPSVPRINEPAPDFEAKSTHGMIKLSTYTGKGKWVLLFSHPADFTPVCTTEFVGFASSYTDFEQRNVQLIGVSVDSVYAHIAWVRSIEENFGVSVRFPVIADLDQAVARAYGMVHQAVSDTATVRAVFVIDPKRIIRALVYYPMSLGRNIPEFLRIIDALQTADANACSTPANWKLGDKVIVPAPATQQDAATRLAGDTGFEVKDWYLSYKTVAESEKK